MNRRLFIDRLGAALRPMPAAAAAEIIADYEGHFAEGLAAGRTEQEVASALGDPERIARELRAEAGLKRWETERSPSAAFSAIIAIIGLGAVDIVFLAPFLMSICGILMGVFIAAFACFLAGGLMLVVGPFAIHDAPLSAVLLFGVGLMSGSGCAGALATLVTIGLINALVWYGRLHLQILRPALNEGEIIR